MTTRPRRTRRTGLGALGLSLMLGWGALAVPAHAVPDPEAVSRPELGGAALRDIRDDAASPAIKQYLRALAAPIQSGVCDERLFDRITLAALDGTMRRTVLLDDEDSVPEARRIVYGDSRYTNQVRHEMCGNAAKRGRYAAVLAKLRGPQKGKIKPGFGTPLNQAKFILRQAQDQALFLVRSGVIREETLPEEPPLKAAP